MTNMQKRDDMRAAMSAMQIYLGEVSTFAADIAHARRALFNAYVAEGFTEAQALDLVKAPIVGGGVA